MPGGSAPVSAGVDLNGQAGGYLSPGSYQVTGLGIAFAQLGLARSHQAAPMEAVRAVLGEVGGDPGRPKAVGAWNMRSTAGPCRGRGAEHMPLSRPAPRSPGRYRRV